MIADRDPRRVFDPQRRQLMIDDRSRGIVLVVTFGRRAVLVGLILAMPGRFPWGSITVCSLS